jgi:hypothetical protein
MLNKNPEVNGPWGIKGAGGWNCFGRDGVICFATKAEAETTIREAGFEPMKVES